MLAAVVVLAGWLDVVLAAVVVLVVVLAGWLDVVLAAVVPLVVVVGKAGFAGSVVVTLAAADCDLERSVTRSWGKWPTSEVLLTRAVPVVDWEADAGGEQPCAVSAVVERSIWDRTTKGRDVTWRSTNR